MKLHNYLPLAESQRRVTETDQANPQFDKLNKSQTVMYSDDKLEKKCVTFFVSTLSDVSLSPILPYMKYM